MKIVTVIPARGGSKSCPRKNIRELNGQPLIAYPILASLRTPEIEETYVTTDDKEIAQISQKYGAEVPYLRPAKYATDTSLDIEWAKHFLDWFYATKGYFPEVLVHLRATTPMVEVDMISRAIEAFKTHPNATSLLSMEEYGENPYKALVIDGDYVKGLFDLKNHFMPKQSFSKVYHLNGYVDILKPSTILKGEIHGDKIVPFITDNAIEIDSEFDFKLLEAMYGER